MHHAPDRTTVLTSLSITGLQLDSLHKHAANEQMPEGDYAITPEEYWALNDALNYYRSIVQYLLARHSDMEYPKTWPQTLDEQVTISQKILLAT